MTWTTTCNANGNGGIERWLPATSIVARLGLPAGTQLKLGNGASVAGDFQTDKWYSSGLYLRVYYTDGTEDSVY